MKLAIATFRSVRRLKPLCGPPLGLCILLVAASSAVACRENDQCGIRFLPNEEIAKHLMFRVDSAKLLYRSEELSIDRIDHAAVVLTSGADGYLLSRWQTNPIGEWTMYWMNDAPLTVVNYPSKPTDKDIRDYLDSIGWFTRSSIGKRTVFRCE
ncbi:MAG: hypothetical protein R3B07_07295 [Polyangiaceae bacterium]